MAATVLLLGMAAGGVARGARSSQRLAVGLRQLLRPINKDN
jgi:hypothetical protein